MTYSINDDIVQVRIQCFVCRSRHELNLPLHAFNEWRSGVLIQDAFPTLSAADRELLISECCNPCFDQLVADER